MTDDHHVGDPPTDRGPIIGIPRDDLSRLREELTRARAVQTRSLYTVLENTDPQHVINMLSATLPDLLNVDQLEYLSHRLGRAAHAKARGE